MFVSEIFDECAEILGTTDETKVFRKITQAVQTLMESGHWTHVTAEVDVCTGWDKCSLALPRGIDIPLAVNIDGSPTYFRNRLFQYHVNKGGMYNSVSWAWDDRGYVSTLMDIITPSQLIAVAESNNDVGKTIRVLGTDQNNRNLRAQTLNGTGVDGILIPIHSQQDFQYGTIAPDGNTIATREVAIDPIKDFTTTTPHGLSSGQGMATRLISGTIPVPLNNGQTYYIGVIDAYTVQLFSDSLNAEALQYPIALQSIQGFGSMQLEDKRTAQVETSLKFVPPSPTFSIDSPNEVVFPVQSLPAPLEAQKTYFAQPIDADHIQIFPSLVDATNNTNPVYLTGSTSAISVDIRKPITPETKLVFSVKHYFNDGDQVQAFTNGGTLPQPLIANQNYFVNVINDFSVSLHSNQADALSSSTTNFVNPIQITTSGSGSNSLVKLIQATSITGIANQITAQGLNITPASGSGATFQAVVVGSVTEVNVTAAGGGYTTAPNITFSAPPTPPIGSPIIPSTATGYAIRNTINNTVSGIVITNAGLGYSTPPSITIDPPPVNTPISILSLTSSGTTATCITVNPHGFTGGNEITINGATPTGYNGTYVISYISPTSFSYTLNASVGYDKSISSLVSGKSVTSITHVTTAATVNCTNHGFSNGQSVIIVGANQSQYNGTFIIVFVNSNQFTYTMASDPGVNATGSITASASSGTIATATTSTNHGFANGQSVFISGATPPAYNKQSIISNVTANTFDYSVDGGLLSPATGTINVFSTPATGTMTCKIKDGSQAVANAVITTSFISHYNLISGGSGYTEAPQVKITGGNGSGATATATIAAGAVTNLNVITTGTGYSSPASVAVSITPSTGVFVNFSSTGALPSPLISGTAYRAESPDIINKTFTVVNADFSEVNVTSSGTGTLYVVLSRSFGIDFTNNWLGDFTSLTTGQQIYFGTDYILPTTTPSIDNGVNPRYLRYISNTLGQIYNTLSNATNPPSTTGLINIDSFGTGQTYYALRTQVTPSVDTNLIKPASLAFLTENEVVQFSTSGTLPAPLAASTDYTIRIIGDSVRVYSGSSPIVLTNAGIGQLSLDIIRDVDVQPSKKIVANSSLYETGTELVVRAKSGDVLPVGLIQGTNYYVRRIDNNSFELYDTLNHATNLTSTIGRKTYTTSGSKVTSTFFTDAIFEATFVKSVSHIEKPLTDGYVSLYAWDYGRSNDMTLIGQYHPTEVNPQYRKIRIGKPCAWARILYKVTPPRVSSRYDFIPLEQERAIIAAVHAVDLEDKDFADQAVRYWGIAYQYLKNQQESIDGHAMTPPQVNGITYGDCSDPVMF